MMESMANIIKDKYHKVDDKLEHDFNIAMEDKVFNKVVKGLKTSKKEIMKHTTQIEETVLELSNCSKCKNILMCKNSVNGHVYYPDVVDDKVVMCYIPCKYQKELDKKNSYYKNITLYDMPLEVREASMKDIYTDDASRFEVIKWLHNYIEKYKKNEKGKGLYLTGNFGCGKTYLVSAMLNELAKLDKKIAIVYYPEFLRSLKASFGDDSEYNTRFNYIKKVELLLIDDIGAETASVWSRDEVLGNILQYRMQEHLSTFFTSNFTLEQLEDHFSSLGMNDERVKARRIMERIKQLSEYKEMISENRRK